MLSDIFVMFFGFACVQSVVTYNNCLQKVLIYFVFLYLIIIDCSKFFCWLNLRKVLWEILEFYWIEKHTSSLLNLIFHICFINLKLLYWLTLANLTIHVSISFTPLRSEEKSHMRICFKYEININLQQYGIEKCVYSYSSIAAVWKYLSKAPQKWM